MCLSIPSKIVSIDETLGVRRAVSLDLLAEPAAVGEYVLIHVGFAMEKIDTQYALESIEIYERIAKDMNEGKIASDEGDGGLKEMKFKANEL